LGGVKMPFRGRNKDEQRKAMFAKRPIQRVSFHPITRKERILEREEKQRLASTGFLSQFSKIRFVNPLAELAAKQGFKLPIQEQRQILKDVSAGRLEPQDMIDIVEKQQNISKAEKEKTIEQIKNAGKARQAREQIQLAKEAEEKKLFEGQTLAQATETRLRGEERYRQASLKAAQENLEAAEKKKREKEQLEEDKMYLKELESDYKHLQERVVTMENESAREAIEKQIDSIKKRIDNMKEQIALGKPSNPDDMIL
jgi:hypothetical protein